MSTDTTGNDEPPKRQKMAPWEKATKAKQAAQSKSRSTVSAKSWTPQSLEEHDKQGQIDAAVMLTDTVGVWSPRPGRFLDIITTGWPRVRDGNIGAETAVGAVTARLWSLLRAESMKAIGAEGA